MAKYKLAELLLRRKELSERLPRIAHVKDKDVYEPKIARRGVTEGVDDILASVPKLSLAEVMAEYNQTASQLRRVDAAIQQANWTVDVECDVSVFDDFKLPERDDSERDMTSKKKK